MIASRFPARPSRAGASGQAVALRRLCLMPDRTLRSDRPLRSGHISKRQPRSVRAAVSNRREDLVSEGVCAQALCAHPLEPLSVAVARLIFRTRIAPGLIVTTLRYVLRAAGLSAELFLDPLVANQLLPPTDHLSSLPRLLAALAMQYSIASDADGRVVLTDDHVFRLVRAAFLGYNYKSVGYRLGLGRHARCCYMSTPHLHGSLHLCRHRLHTSQWIRTRAPHTHCLTLLLALVFPAVLALPCPVGVPFFPCLALLMFLEK